MADVKEVIKAQLDMGADLLTRFSSDLSDEEYLFQPTQGGCHANWILGHLACTQDWAISHVAGRPMRIAPKLHEVFKGGSVVHADASKYPPRSEVDAMFREAQANALAALDAFDLSRWNESTPETMPTRFFPTWASLWCMLPTHTFWHFGQLTVNRRMMGKPPRFFV